MKDTQTVIKENLIQSGASLVGFADTRILHNDLSRAYPYAVSIAIALDREVVGNILRGPTPAYYEEYLKVNQKLAILSQQLRSLIDIAGYKTHMLNDYEATHDLPHKTAATLAGLGWVGKSNLLVTKAFGSAVRLATIPTTMPLVCGEPITESQCGVCSICAAVCPAKAIKGKLWHQSIATEDMYKAHVCEDKARELSRAIGVDKAICGICMANCPWTMRYSYGNGGQ